MADPSRALIKWVGQQVRRTPRTRNLHAGLSCGTLFESVHFSFPHGSLLCSMIGSTLVYSPCSLFLSRWMRPRPSGKASSAWLVYFMVELLSVCEVHGFPGCAVFVVVFIEFVFWPLLNYGSAPGPARLAFVSWCGLRLCRSTSDTVPWSLCSCSPWSSRPQPLGSGGDATPCEDSREERGLHL